MLCPEPPKEGGSVCQKCLDRSNAQSKRKYLARKEAGVCYRCASTVVEKCTVCLKCWFKKKAVDNLGSETRWESLRDKLIAQDHTCPYTGLKLEPGGNASVDHIFPSSLYPELEYELSNVEWVDMRFNRTKFDYTEDQFFHLCMAVLARKYQDRLGDDLSIALTNRLVSESVNLSTQ